MDDVRAVMDAAGSESASLLGYSEGGPLGVLFATSYPERTRSLVLYGTYAKPATPTTTIPGRRRASSERTWRPSSSATWGENMDVTTIAPKPTPRSAPGSSTRPRAARARRGARDLILMNSKADVRELLPSVSCPTLVLHRTGDLDVHIEEGRYLAGHIPGARFVALAGDDHFCRRRRRPDLSTRSRSSSPGRGPRVSRTASSPPFSPPTSSARRSTSRISATRAGLPCSTSTTRRCAVRSAASPARSSTPPATASSPPSTGRHGRSGVPSRSGARSSRSVCTSVPACTRARSSGVPARSRAGSPSTSRRVIARSPPATRCS